MFIFFNINLVKLCVVWLWPKLIRGVKRNGGSTIAVGETRKVFDARITSIHFPVLRYFAIFASRCLIGRGNSGNRSVPYIVILCHALFRDNTVSLGAIVAKRLSLNRTKGPIFGGIYAARLAKHFEIPIRHYEKEETLLPLPF